MALRGPQTTPPTCRQQVALKSAGSLAATSQEELDATASYEVREKVEGSFLWERIKNGRVPTVDPSGALSKLTCLDARPCV